MAIIGTKRERLRGAQHREVQAGEEPEKTSAATRASGPDGGKELAHLLGRGNHTGIDLIDAAVGRFPFSGVERVLTNPGGRARFARLLCRYPTATGTPRVTRVGASSTA